MKGASRVPYGALQRCLKGTFEGTLRVPYLGYCMGLYMYRQGIAWTIR